jgi:hypothetical protein
LLPGFSRTSSLIHVKSFRPNNAGQHLPDPFSIADNQN